MAFLRRIYYRYHKLGKKKGKNRTWRKPKGRDNKMREKRRGHMVVVSIGYRSPNSQKKEMFILQNTGDFSKIQKGMVVILGKVGKKKKIEIAKIANEKGIQFENFNTKKFIKKMSLNSGGQKK